MTYQFRALVMVVAFALASGCSTHRMAEQTRLPLHPIHETRMTNQPAPGYVPTGVWRVRGKANTVYLVGTCHVVADDEIPFPSSYYAAYRDSQEVLVEADSLSFSGTWLVMSASPGAMMFFLKHASEFMCPKGKSLEDYVSPEMARQLREHYGDAYEESKRFTPLGLVFFAEFDGISEGNAGADDLFSLLAHRDGKRIRSLDTRKAPKLIGPVLNAMLNQARSEIASRGADAVLKEALLDNEEGRVDWRYGDTSAAEKEVAELKRTDPKLYEQLLPERNREWFPAITRALAGKRNFMVLVGALHLAGADGLVEMLRREGFKPEQMYGIDRPQTPKRTVVAE